VLRIVTVLVLVAALGGCGGDQGPDEDPGAFATTLVRQLDRGNTAAAWTELQPVPPGEGAAATLRPLRAPGPDRG
jgi:hypothetical protein